MSKQGAPIPIPENWDELTDDEKDAVTAQLLKGVADQAGIDRGSAGRTGGTEKTRSRRFTKDRRP